MIVCDIPPGEAADADPGGADDSAAVAAAGPLGAAQEPAAAGMALGDLEATPADVPDVLSGDAAPQSPVETVTSWAVAHPWILLAIAIPAARLIAR